MAEQIKDAKGIETKKVMCWPSPGCCSGCGLLVQVKDDKIVGMRGNPEFPNNRGAVCAERFPHLLKWLNHPGQLMYPLKRKGDRGDNRWERISWDQALDEIADKLKELKAQYGAETLSVIEGTLRSDLYGIRTRFLHLFGNPSNMGTAGTSCGCNRENFEVAVAGTNVGYMPKIQEDAHPLKCFVFCGSNLPQAYPIPWRQLKKRRQGPQPPKLIVIDPRRTEIAEAADIWMQIRPGTDSALFLAWLNVIINEQLYDKEFVEKWTFGFEQLKQRVAEYPPERVSEITWIPVDQIRKSARMYAANNPGFIHIGLACDHPGFNSLRIEQAKICLQAIVGNMRADLGNAPQGPGPFFNGKIGIRDSMLQLEDKCTPEQRKKQLGSDLFKLMTWPFYEIMAPIYKQVYGVPLCMSGHSFSAPENLIWRSIVDRKPYPTTALLTWTSNPIINSPNTKMVYKALKSPNLQLHVVVEHMMTPTAMLADYILPAASKLERGVLSSFEDFLPIFLAGERAIQPLGERKHDYQVFRGLAVRLGFGEYFPWKTEEELYNYRLAPLGITYEQAAKGKYTITSPEPWTYATINPRTGKSTGFATISGKLELYSNVLEKLGYDPLPYYEEPPESPIRTPDIAHEYPLILTTGGRFLPQFQSENRQWGMGMREQHPDPLMDIHPDTAKKLGIVEGDWAYIETRRGVIKMKANITDKIHPKVINCEHNWWFPEQPGQEPWLHGMWESNCNVLTMDDPDASDQTTGSWPMGALLCKVYKVITPTAPK